MSGLPNAGNTCYCNVILQLLSPFDYLFRLLQDHKVNHVDGKYSHPLQPHDIIALTTAVCT